MYVKLILKNAKKSGKDYLIYLVTLTLCVALFYSFLSISSKYYHPGIGAEYSIKSLGNTMKLAILFITAILLFLINYVNKFMIRRKQKEFAIQTILGMEQRNTGILFFIETFIIGVFAIVIGIIIGILLSQIVTAMLLSTYGAKYQITFSLFPDTVMITVIFFCICFLLIGIMNIRTICKIKVIDMLHASRKTEVDFHKNRWIQFWMVAAALVSIPLFIQGISIYRTLYDARFALTVRIILWGNVVMPAIFLITAISNIIVKVHNKNKSRSPILIALIIISIFIIEFIVNMIGSVQKYYLPLQENQINVYLIYVAFYFVFLICAFFYLIGDGLSYLKKRFIKVRYKRENLFLFGQLISKLKTTSKTMSIVCITLVSSIILIILAPIMFNWMMGFLNSKSSFELQAFSSYNNIYKKENLGKNNYEFLQKYLNSQNISSEQSVLYQNYFIDSKDFKNRYKYNFPVLAISLSDYNRLRQMVGTKPISLGKDEFTTQWYVTATKKEQDTFLKAHKTVKAGGTELLQSEIPVYHEELGENIYNSYTNLIYIFPDEVCDKLLAANQFLFINTKNSISYEKAKKIEKYFTKKVAHTDEVTGCRTEIRLHTLEVNESTSYAFIAKTMMLYAGVVLFIICFTVLAVQQLADASDSQYRFTVLRKMGVDESRINALVLKQLGVWFGLPVIVALVAAVLLLVYFIRSSFTQLSAYVGMHEIYTSIWSVSSIILVLLCAYFVSTWILFQNSIKE